MFGFGRRPIIGEMDYLKLLRVGRSRPDVDVSLRIVWWNTGLAALTQKLHQAESNSEKVKGKKKIKGRIDERNNLIWELAEKNDILVLGEYKNEFEIKRKIATRNVWYRAKGITRRLDCVDLNYEAGEKMKFHNFIIFDASAVRCFPRSKMSMTCANVGSCSRTRRYRAYQVVKFVHSAASDFSFEIFVVHWNMRNFFEGESRHQLRLKAAERLLKRTEKKNGFPYKIVVGDFNNEPFEDGLYWLGGSRSQSYVAEFGGLYNPFWRYLGLDKYTLHSPKNREFMSQGAIFDHMLVNQAFLTAGSEWKICPSILENQYELQVNDHNPVRLLLKR